MSTLGDEYIGMFSTSGGYHDACGEQVDKSLSSSIENPNVLNILIVSPTCIMISLQCTEHSPMYS